MLTDLIKTEMVVDGLGLLSHLTRTIGENIIRSKLVYSVNLHDIHWDIRLILSRFFDIERAIDTSTNPPSIVLDTSPSNTNRMSPSVYWYHGTPLMLHHRTGSKVNYSTNNNITMSPTKDLYLSTIKTEANVNNLKTFIDKLIKMGAKVNAGFYKGKSLMLNNGENSGYFIDAPRRTFDDVFLRKSDKELIIKSITKFLHSRSWYEKNNIPYHFGLMLYGCPASGKSSVAQAIAHRFNACLSIIPGDEILSIPGFVASGAIPRNPNYLNVILVEDCDCGIKSIDFIPRHMRATNEDDEENKRPKGMAQLLNSLDGFGAPVNTIYIFTTNHIEKLDPALIRPGRIDLKVDIGPVCRETFDQFCMKHFNEVSSEKFEIRDGVTFADLQTDIMVGKSLEDLVSIYGLKYLDKRRDVK